MVRLKVPHGRLPCVDFLCDMLHVALEWLVFDDWNTLSFIFLM